MVVSIVKVADHVSSLREAVGLCNGFAGLDRHTKVLVKPNISVGSGLPPYGMITTTRILEALLELLIEHGCADITIGEGSIDVLGLDTRKAYARTHIDRLAAKYGARLIDLNRGPFRHLDLGGLQVEVAQSALDADFLINVPALKTHGLTKVSLAFKNLKGCLSPASKMKFHCSGRLNELICLLNEVIRSHLTIIDGTYMLEKGPDTLLGTAHRKDVVVVSRDAFACDVAGTTILGIDPADVGHLRTYAERHSRSLTTDAIQIEGERDINSMRERLEWKPDVPKDLLAPFGISGISVPHPGDSLCSRCYANLGLALVAFLKDNPGTDCGGVVICCGNGANQENESQKTLLYGNCAIRNHDDSDKAVAVRGCPPRLLDTLLALHVMVLGRRRSARVVPKELLELAGAKMGVYEYTLPKWTAYDSERFDKRHFEVSRKRSAVRSRAKPARH